MNLIKKLIEDVDIKQRTTPLKRSPDEDNMTTATHSNVLGVGQEAVVFKNSKPQNSGVVTKWVRNQQKDFKSNGTIQYLIQSSKIGNPFFPTVYEIKQLITKDQKYDYYIKMERLNSTLSHIYNKLDENQRGVLYRQIIQDYDDTPIDDSDELVDIIGDFLFFGSARVGPNKWFPTDTLSTALDLLSKVVQEQGLGNYDIHDENIMVRLTSTGMQLVITDPVYSGEYNN